MIYLHVMEKGVAGTSSPLDGLDDVSFEEMAAALAATRGCAGHDQLARPSVPC